MSDDNARLDRLFEYTKFHIGIYILAAGAMVTIAGSEQLRGFFDSLFKPFLFGAIVLMFVAGLAGGVIASTCACAATFDEVWKTRIGPWLFTKHLRFPGHMWARIEHLAFWASAICFAVAMRFWQLL